MKCWSRNSIEARLIERKNIPLYSQGFQVPEKFEASRGKLEQDFRQVARKRVEKKILENSKIINNYLSNRRD